MRKNKTQNISKFLQKRPFRIACRIMPVAWFRFLIILMGKWYYRKATNQKVRIIRQVLQTRDFLKLKKDTKATVEGIFIGIYLHYHEKYITGYYKLNRYQKYFIDNITPVNLNILDEILNVSKNAILVTAHFGAVEFFPSYFAFNNYRIRMIAKGKTKKIMKTYKQRARQKNMSLIDASSKDVFQKAVRWLTHGKKRILIVMGDEFKDWKISKKKKGHFLNRQIYLDRFIELLHLKSRAPVLSGFMIRKGINHYQLEIVNISNNNKKINNITQNILTTLESYIKKYPEQWYQWSDLNLPEIQVSKHEN